MRRAPGPVGRWLTFLTTIHGRVKPRVLTYDADGARRHQAAAARRAFLASLPPAQLPTRRPIFGDTQ